MYPSQGEENNMSEVTQAEKKEYQKYIKKVTPTHNLWLQMGKAFLVGGIICCIGQFLLNTGSNMGMDEKTAGSFCSLILILASVLLTGFHCISDFYDTKTLDTTVIDYLYSDLSI